MTAVNLAEIQNMAAMPTIDVISALCIRHALPDQQLDILPQPIGEIVGHCIAEDSRINAKTRDDITSRPIGKLGLLS